MDLTASQQHITALEHFWWLSAICSEYLQEQGNTYYSNISHYNDSKELVQFK